MKSIAVLSVIPLCVWAQQDAAPPSFEVASVKVAEAPKMLGGGGGGVFRVGGCGKPDPALVRCSGATLRAILLRAYDVKNYQIEGPDWINTENYDVMAKVPEGVPADKVPAMLQALLAERFALKVHKITKELPTYDLIAAKGGPKLKEVDVDKLPKPGSAPPPPPPRTLGPRPLSSMPAGTTMMMMSANGSRVLRGNITLDQLANQLTGALGRPVFDRTDLKGTYEIELSYLGDENDGMGRTMANLPLPPPDSGVGGHGDGARQADNNAPIATVFQAVQQTLGLKLEPRKAPVEIIVVDSANKAPTEN